MALVPGKACSWGSEDIILSKIGFEKKWPSLKNRKNAKSRNTYNGKED